MDSDLEDFFLLSSDILIEIREQHVPSDAAFDDLCSLLDQLGDSYRHSDSLPKTLVGVLVDMSTALYSAAEVHPEPARDQLFYQFDRITDKIRDLCS